MKNEHPVSDWYRGILSNICWDSLYHNIARRVSWCEICVVITWPTLESQMSHALKNENLSQLQSNSWYRRLRIGNWMIPEYWWTTKMSVSTRNSTQPYCLYCPKNCTLRRSHFRHVQFIFLLSIWQSRFLKSLMESITLSFRTRRDLKIEINNTKY